MQNDINKYFQIYDDGIPIVRFPPRLEGDVKNEVFINPAKIQRPIPVVDELSDGMQKNITQSLRLHVTLQVWKMLVMMRMESLIFCLLVQRNENEKNQKENSIKNQKRNQKLNENKSVNKNDILKEEHQQLFQYVLIKEISLLIHLYYTYIVPKRTTRGIYRAQLRF